jgi:hypothetical protein
MAHTEVRPDLVYPAWIDMRRAGVAAGAAPGAGRHDRACYLGDRHMGHIVGPPSSAISAVTSKPCRR